MTGAAEYGARVPLADATSELPYPGMVRLALELLWSQLDLAEEPEERAAEKALWALHKKLWDKELEAVAATGMCSHYLIIRPVNPLCLPPPEVASEIRDAIATLIRHGMIAGRSGDDAQR